METKLCIGDNVKLYVGDNAKLTPTQQKVKMLLLTGSNLDQIASQLKVTRKTVKFHLTSVYKAYGVKTRADLLSKELARFLQNESSTKGAQ